MPPVAVEGSSAQERWKVGCCACAHGQGAGLGDANYAPCCSLRGGAGHLAGLPPIRKAGDLGGCRRALGPQSASGIDLLPGGRRAPHHGGSSFLPSSDSLLSHVEQLLRAFILKISVCDAVLDHNPPGCTFTVLVHTREAATRNMEKIQVIKDFPWILADEQDVHMHDPRLIPLKTMTSDILKMQLYVEERAQKSS